MPVQAIFFRTIKIWYLKDTIIIHCLDFIDSPVRKILRVANKSIYSDYRKSRNKEKFYDDHRAELTLYESALRILKEKSQGKKLPTLKMLREEKNRLTELQTVQRDEFNTQREYERELRTVCSNVDIILSHPHIQEPLPEASQEHSCFR